MARPLRIEYKNAFYHITSRGNNLQKIYRSNKDYNSFLATLQEVIREYNWLCYAWCLMPNHYHLLIETPDANLSLGMRQLNGIYSQRFNKRHSHVGHVFQGRFKGILVEKDSHLLELSRYIVLNSVRANIVSRPEQWPWSSYKGMLEKTQKEYFIKRDWLLLQFGSYSKAAMEVYRQFVLAGINKPDPWGNLKNRIFLGSDKWIQQVSSKEEIKINCKEITRQERYFGRPELKKVFSTLITKHQRNELIYKAHKQYGYTFTDIGKCLNIHYSVVSRAFRKQAGRDAQNKT